MNRKTLEQKIQKVNSYKEKINSSSLVILFNFFEIETAPINDLRSKLKKNGGEFLVGKNTLFYRAFEDTVLHDHKEIFINPTALIFAYNDPVTVAKIVYEKCKELDKEKPERFLKGGLLDGKFLSTKDIVSLASLPPKDVLISKLLGVIQAPVVGLVMALKSVPAKLVLTLKAIEEKKG